MSKKIIELKKRKPAKVADPTDGFTDITITLLYKGIGGTSVGSIRRPAGKRNLEKEREFFLEQVRNEAAKLFGMIWEQVEGKSPKK